MTVNLIAYTQLTNHGARSNPMTVVEEAACVCYDSNPTENFRIAKGCMKSGHTSVYEHINFVFHVSGVSRALLAQLTRHRIAGFSVRSQRYCNEDGFDYIIPETARDTDSDLYYTDIMFAANEAYNDLIDAGMPPEDARMVLPNACCTELVVSMNARALIEASRQRLCSRAQWEIRKLFTEMKREVATVCPEVAEYMRPKCETDPEYPFCTEAKCCGRHKTLAEVYKG